MTISAAKAALIVVFFMEIRRRSPAVWVALAIGIYWLAILFALCLGDYMTRDWK
jgi:caa(3)-type oxidase subunit IV